MFSFKLLETFWSKRDCFGSISGFSWLSAKAAGIRGFGSSSAALSGVAASASTVVFCSLNFCFFLFFLLLMFLIWLVPFFFSFQLLCN